MSRGRYYAARRTARFDRVNVGDRVHCTLVGGGTITGRVATVDDQGIGVESTVWAGSPTSGEWVDTVQVVAWKAMRSRSVVRRGRCEDAPCCGCCY